MKKIDIKWGVQIVAFNEVDFLEATIRMFQPFVNKIVVSTGDKSWEGNIKNDGSVEKVVEPLTEEFENVHIVRGNYDSEENQRNDTLTYLSEYNFVFIVDADEMWSSGDINKTKDYIAHRQGYNVFRSSWNTRFKNLDWRVNPREPFKPIVVIRKGITFSKNREVESTPETAAILIPEKIVLVEHFSYVRNDDNKIKEKISTFSHANEIIGGIDMWYENIYLQADLESTNLHPTHPECYTSIMKDVVDSEIIKFLKEYSPQLFKDE